MATIVGVSGGTTEPSTMPRICTRSMRLRENKPSTSNPNSSDVRSRSVCSRQLSTSVWPSNTPRTMLVLPTSMAKSMSVPDDFAGHDSCRAIADPHQQRAGIVDAGGDAGDCAGAAHPRDARAARRRRPLAPGVENIIEPAGDEVVVPPRERGERRLQHDLAVDALEIGRASC